MIYKNDYLNEISFPIGGIGSGSIGLSGNGNLVDWEIFNRPDKGSVNGYSHIAVKVKNKDGKFVKALCGDVNKDFTGVRRIGPHNGLGGYGLGVDMCNMNAFPHFKNCEFNGEFPICELTFSDSDFPGKVILKAFNPFIPLDSKNSSIPAAFFEVTYKNESHEEAEFQCVFSLANPFLVSENTSFVNGSVSTIKLINKEKNSDEIHYGDLSLSCSEPDCVQKYWYRGTWMDGISTFWNEFFNNDTLSDRNYDTAGKKDTCSISKTLTLKPFEEKSVRFVISWNIPNNYNYWSNPEEHLEEKPWKNYYATVFEDSVASGVYSIENWDMLYGKTKAFKDELFACSVPDVVKEAVSSTMSVLKTPTVFRLENGGFYGWEGCFDHSGSCEGTCQHVWNYAYALCFLFPELERSIRNLEFKYSMEESGEMQFRLKLPLGRKGDYFRPCVDGQMGSVIKTYREWKLSGDNEWLKEVWPSVKKALEFAWSEENYDMWDRDKDGILEGRQHHTLDMELFGPSSWLQGFYLAALKSASEMAEFLGENKKAQEYRGLFEKGKKWTEENLFNGNYFIQKININDKSITDKFDCSQTYWNEETKQIKYQITDGSSIDQLTAQWHANLCGLGDIFDEKQRKTALVNMYKNNFKKSMRDVTNMWRVFSVNDESGAIMCDYPEGVQKPVIPISYCEECMTGFEYQLAGLLISEGFVDEGIEIVSAIRNRYDGKKRNPWNEIECGSNYARAMASFAILPLISGYRFDLPHNFIGFNPVIKEENFRTVWFLSSGWGNMLKSSDKVRINVIDGNAELSCIGLEFIKKPQKLFIDTKELTFSFENGNIIFDKTVIKQYAEIIYEK